MGQARWRGRGTRLIAVFALMFVLSGMVGGLSAQASTARQEGTTPAQIGTMTIVVAGTDSRTPNQPTDTPENTDVLMLARIDIPNHTLRVVSIPRDLYVQIPGVGYDKITRAYDYGSKADNGKSSAGAALVEQTIEANFGIKPDAMVMTTFQGFQNIVDAVGGVDVNNPYEVYDDQYPTDNYGTMTIDFPAGEQHLNGTQALEFARTRHQDGDNCRVMRQRIILRALLDKMHDPSIAPNLLKLVAKERDTVLTDLTPGQILALAMAVPSFTNDDVTFTTLESYIWADTSPAGAWIYSGDWNAIPGYVQGFLAGTEAGNPVASDTTC